MLGRSRPSRGRAGGSRGRRTRNTLSRKSFSSSESVVRGVDTWGYYDPREGQNRTVRCGRRAGGARADAGAGRGATGPGGARRAAVPGAGSGGPAPAADQAQPQPTFRGGIDFVSVDVIVTDGKEAPVLDLSKADFEIIEDGKPQSIEQFRLIRVDGNPKPGEPPPRQIRNRDDEELEASREDTRVFAILLDDYHTRRSNSISVREPLTEFVQTQLRPNDMVALMYPLTPVSDISFTRDHDQVLSAIQRFEGRKYDYRPRNAIEEELHALLDRHHRAHPQRRRHGRAARADDAARLAARGAQVADLRQRGFTAMLPPQMRRQDASAPGEPDPVGGGGGQRRQRARDDRRVVRPGRRHAAHARGHRTWPTATTPRSTRSIRAALPSFEFGMDDTPGRPPSFATDSRALRMTQDTLRILSEDTDGRAIVNRNTLAPGAGADDPRLELLLPARLHHDGEVERREVPRDQGAGEAAGRATCARARVTGR